MTDYTYNIYINNMYLLYYFTLYPRLSAVEMGPCHPTELWLGKFVKRYFEPYTVYTFINVYIYNYLVGKKTFHALFRFRTHHCMTFKSSCCTIPQKPWSWSGIPIPMLDAKTFSQWNKTKHEPECRWSSATNLWFRPYFTSRTPKTQGVAKLATEKPDLSRDSLIPWGANCLTDSVHISKNSKLSKLMNQWASFNANRDIQISSFFFKLWIIIHSLNDLKNVHQITRWPWRGVRSLKATCSSRVLPPVVSCAASSWNLPAPPSAVRKRGINRTGEMVISPGKPRGKP